MQKIISLFKRNYEGTRLVHDEIVPGAEWVINGEGVATVKKDGTCCLIEDGNFYRRYDRKLTKEANKQKKRDSSFIPTVENYKPAPEGWEAAELEPNEHTGHWPGWVSVGEGPSDQYHREAYTGLEVNGTWELLGPKVQGNPYELDKHILHKHGSELCEECPITFDELKLFFATRGIEGIVWHHSDGRMVKIKRKDFGFSWPDK